MTIPIKSFIVIVIVAVFDDESVSLVDDQLLFSFSGLPLSVWSLSTYPKCNRLLVGCSIVAIATTYLSALPSKQAIAYVVERPAKNGASFN